jgi:hypothetical protein
MPICANDAIDKQTTATAINTQRMDGMIRIRLFSWPILTSRIRLQGPQIDMV